MRAAAETLTQFPISVCVQLGYTLLALLFVLPLNTIARDPQNV